MDLLSQNCVAYYFRNKNYMRKLLCKIFGHKYHQYEPPATSVKQWVINSLILNFKLNTNICLRCNKLK